MSITGGKSFSAKGWLKHYLELGKDDEKIHAGVTSDSGVNIVELMEFY